jgi:hypothetical protein
MRLGNILARMVEKRNPYRLLVGRREGKGPFWKTRRKWEANIKMDLGEIGWGGIDWIGLDQDIDILSWECKSP